MKIPGILKQSSLASPCADLDFLLSKIKFHLVYLMKGWFESILVSLDLIVKNGNQTFPSCFKIGKPSYSLVFKHLAFYWRILMKSIKWQKKLREAFLEAKCIVHQSLLLLALMKGLFLTQKMPRASRQLRKCSAQWRTKSLEPNLKEVI